MTFLITWIIVGLVAGFLAALVVRRGKGYGLIGAMIVGIAGAIIGGYVFRALEIEVPVPGIAGSIIVAFVGAVLLLLVIRLAYRRRHD